VRKQLVDYGAWVRAAQDGDQEVKDYLRRLDGWSAEYFQKWYGVKGDLDFHYATTITRARAGDRRVETELVRLATDRKQPGIVRATALTELGQFESEDAVQAFRAGLRDRDPQVRSVAAGLAPRFSGERRVADLGSLLEDPRRLVRTEAARVLSDVPPHRLNARLKPLFEAAIQEYQDGLTLENDRVGAHLMLGVLHENQRQWEDARRDYERALLLDPTVTGPRAHLADLLERNIRPIEGADSNAVAGGGTGGDVRAKQLLRRVAELRREELELYARDASLLPNNAALQYRWGSSLYLNGQVKEATTVLERAVELAPRNPQYVLFLTLIYQKQQRFPEAVAAVNKLLALRPSNASYLQLQRELRQQATPPERNR
jgi:tetratricopeptide (TPR) repeat protein